MPILVRTSDLQPGMRLYEALLSQGRMLLPGGHTITQVDVESLGRRFPNTSVRIGDPVLDEFAEFEDDSHAREVAHNVQAKIANSMSEVRAKFANRASLEGVNFGAIQNVVTNVLAYLRENPVSSALLSQTLSTGSYLSDHAGNVFYLSMLLGARVAEYIAQERNRQTKARSLKYEFAFDMTPLAIGAMLIDVGMLPLQHLYKQKERLTQEDHEAVRQHPVEGVRMLPEKLSAISRMIVRTHHENLDGTGYPDRLPGDKIHIFSRIVRIADAFDAATSQQVFKQAKSPARVLWEMSHGPYRRCYDPALLKVFSSLIQPFPIGGKLQLTDGRQAVVVRYNPGKPFFPMVIIAFDHEGRRLPETSLVGPLKLDEERRLRVESFNGEDISDIFDSITSEGQGNQVNPESFVSKEFSDLYEAAFP